jgi:DNA-binding SARP family transcriptional activator
VLRLVTLGGLSITHAERPLGGASAQPRRLALLAVLARAGERGIGRERVLALFWPDEEEERARRALAQALYALRRDLGDEGAIVGTQQLRVDAAVLASDVAEFTAHVQGGRLAEAAACYTGPFLQGFHLAGAPTFERWMEEERRALQREHARVLERLATAAERAHRPDEALAHWRALVALDPLDARITMRLMEALAAVGDRAGALRQARIHEVLLAEELELEPDRAVVALAERLRATPPAAAPTVEAVEPAPAVPERPAEPEIVAALVDGADAEPLARSAPLAFHHVRRRRALLAVALVVPALAAVAVLATRGRGGALPDTARGAHASVLAVGLIDDFRTDATAEARPLADMLATNLARAEGLRVVSPGRMHELARQIGRSAAAPGALVGAARQAGASDLIEGTLYRRDDGVLRLDLRYVALASGAVRHALTVQARDVFALADSATAHLLTLLGAARPEGSIASVTTRSTTAYRLYDEGVRAYYDGNVAAAKRLFQQALADDSTFAMAAYYLSLTSYELGDLMTERYLVRAVTLAERASPRERLLIRVGRASLGQLPELRVLAESLVTRYPDEIEGHVALALGLTLEGADARARSYLERALAMDSLGLRGGAVRCGGCTALQRLTETALRLDSLALAERDALRWTRLQPRSAGAWFTLGSIYDRQGRWADAERAYGAMSALAPAPEMTRNAMLTHALWRGALDEAERMVRGRVQVGSPAEQSGAWWDLGIVLRHQGRMREAREAARRYRVVREAAHAATPEVGPAPALVHVPEAVVLLEDGQAREAAALFRRIAEAERRAPGDGALTVRRYAWYLTHAASAHAAVGDTAGLARVVRDIAAVQSSATLLNPLYANYAPGLLALARGDTARAIAALRAATPTPGDAYTRAQLALARTLARTGRTPEAVRVLQAAVRGDFQAMRYYLTHTELHAELAATWELAGGAGARDSAAVHWRYVADAWARGDPPYAARAARARERLAALR